MLNLLLKLIILQLPLIIPRQNHHGDDVLLIAARETISEEGTTRVTLHWRDEVHTLATSNLASWKAEFVDSDFLEPAHLFFTSSDFFISFLHSSLSRLPDPGKGVDFIEILRHLDLFIALNNYNLIEQSFVERKPEPGTKSLSTMNIKCISASLKQHGFGVVGSAVNVCYKLLSKVRSALD